MSEITVFLTQNYSEKCFYTSTSSFDIKNINKDKLKNSSKRKLKIKIGRTNTCNIKDDEILAEEVQKHPGS